MTRPVRVDVEGGWYHITARGIERRTIISGKSEAKHFLELLKPAPARMRARLERDRKLRPTLHKCNSQL